MRYYIGVDWADEEHAVWVEDEQGQRVSAGRVPHSPVGFSEWGRQLDECARRASCCGRRSSGRRAGWWTVCWTMA